MKELPGDLVFDRGLWDPTTLLGRFLFSLNLEVLFAVIFKGWDDRDILAGDYFQAVQGLNFYVEFNRNK